MYCNNIVLRGCSYVQHWGYFQRRMSISREKETPLSSQDIPVFDPGSTEISNSPYGSPPRPWRFFESVPNKLSSMRTKEAAEVAQRHLR